MKVNKTISMEKEIFDKLSNVHNASQLIEDLLKTHFDLAVLEAKPQDTPEELDAKARELNLRLEEITAKKETAKTEEEIINELKKIGIDNQFLIERLKKFEVEPGIFQIRSMREQYMVKSDQIFDALHVLHPEWYNENNS